MGASKVGVGEFPPADSKDVLMAGCLAHATGMGQERQSHVQAGTATGRVGRS